MDMIKRSIRYWGISCLQCIGIAMLAALVLLAFVAMGKEGMADGIPFLIYIYPYYLLLSGSIILVMVIISYMQFYLSVLVSMGVTRKAAIGGILISPAVVTLGIVLIMDILWHLVPGESEGMEQTLLPVMAAGMLFACAATLLLGTLCLRWGKKGIIATLLLVAFAVAGVIAVSMQADGQKVYSWIQSVSDHTGMLVMASLLVYLAAGAFMAVVNRQYEVRV